MFVFAIFLNAEEPVLLEKKDGNYDSLVAGMNFSTNTFHCNKNDLLHNGERAYTTYMEDEFEILPYLLYKTPDNIHGELYHLLYGHNFYFQYSSFEINKIFNGKEYKDDGVSKIKGDILYALPLFFVKVEDKVFDIYGKFGIGVGLALFKYSGTVEYRSWSSKVSEDISYEGFRPVSMIMYETGFKNYMFSLQFYNVNGDSDKEHFIYSNLSFNIGYIFKM